eukprot:TRINITY_DN1273_c0_g1_i6.p2 TRINITY_DN1273_c0_g1~~TRINITY_DN1273_c0_g1_i6.p2  ORF type:complete len:104 (+),score=16.85 TRINITY_DN1273_c0_g1_i6:830-1141(+)
MDGTILDASQDFTIRHGDLSKLIMGIQTTDYNLDGDIVPLCGGNFKIVRSTSSIHGFDVQQGRQIHVTCSKSQVLVAVYDNNDDPDPAPLLDEFTKYLTLRGY